MSKSVAQSKLLIIDDDTDMVKLLSHIVEKAFGNTITIESITEPALAQSRLEAASVDILLTDLEMPGSSGIDLLRLAKQVNPCTQVLFLTGNSTSACLLQALEFGATDYLIKPVDPSLLVELVSQAHSRERRWRKALAETWRANKSGAATV